MRLLPTLATVLCFGISVLAGGTARADAAHGIAMHGEPALPADFDHLPYADPKAPEGGSITYGVVGTFDSLNPFVLKGMRTTARGLWDPQFGNLVFESLMMRSATSLSRFMACWRIRRIDDDRPSCSSTSIRAPAGRTASQ